MTTRILASALALTALASAQTVQAQEACVPPKDLSDTITYAMPIAYEATLEACGTKLSTNGFMRNGGRDFADRFRAKQDTAWPGAKRLLMGFMQRDAAEKGGEQDPMIGMISTMPDDAVRPFVDALVQQMIAGEIKPDSCSKIERGVELISPLPVENISGLTTFLVEIVDVKNPEICSATPRFQSAE